MVNIDLLKLHPNEIKIVDCPNRGEKDFIIPVHTSIVECQEKIETIPDTIISELIEEFDKEHKGIFSYKSLLFLDNNFIRAYYNGIGATGITMSDVKKRPIPSSMVSFSKEKSLTYDKDTNTQHNSYDFYSYAYTSKNVIGDKRARFLIKFGCKYVNAVIDEMNKKDLLED
ncbi:MAG: hypothetical protein PHU12_01700 [Candidatus Aenigmarchaeota archaeon]|nr:hypothetical protein [Candidatus Aenigmarchaeota archaeon]